MAGSCIMPSRAPHQQHQLVLILVPAACAVCAAIFGYRAGAVAWRRKQDEEQAKAEKAAHMQGPAAGMQHHLPLREMIYESTGRGFGAVKRIFVVPGGGPGSAKDAGYPPWTAQRVAKALERYDAKFGDTTAFLALGAGSMNAPSARGGNGHVVFESARIAEELVRGGVPPGSIIADFASWDTVGNAWFARMAVEAILDLSYRHGDRASEPHAAPPPPAYMPPPPSAAASAPARELPYPGSAMAEGDSGGGQAGGEERGAEGLSSARGHDDVRKDDDDYDERKSPELVEPLRRQTAEAGGGGAAGNSGSSRMGAAWGATQKETKRADALARAAAAAAVQTGAGAGGPATTAAGAAGSGLGGEEKLPAARAGEAYEGGEMRRWMYDWKVKKARARKGPLNLTVFVSDFHAERMDTVFQWVFGLEPSLLRGKTTVTTVSIDTPVEMWARGAEQRTARQAHERAAADQARQQAKDIRTMEEFRAFMILGGHKGYFNLTHGRYRASPGGGWGGPT